MADAQGDFWKYVHDLYVRVSSAAPDRRHAIVEIETNDGSTFEPRAVQPYPPFVVCDLAQENTEIVALRETDVRRVRIRLMGEDEKVAVGFRVGEPELE